MRRRLNIVPFNNKPVEPDRELDAKLKAEWPGILRWLIEGCLAWQKGGLQPPAIVQDTTRDYFDAQDSFGTWLDDACIVEPGNSCRKATTKALFFSWSTYARDANEPSGTERSFADRLTKRGLRKDKNVPTSPGLYARGFSGIELRERPLRGHPF
jgi:putative DNA primase/helicase